MLAVRPPRRRVSRRADGGASRSARPRPFGPLIKTDPVPRARRHVRRRRNTEPPRSSCRSADPDLPASRGRWRSSRTAKPGDRAVPTPLRRGVVPRHRRPRDPGVSNGRREPRRGLGPSPGMWRSRLRCSAAGDVLKRGSRASRSPPLPPRRSGHTRRGRRCRRRRTCPWWMDA